MDAFHQYLKEQCYGIGLVQRLSNIAHTTPSGHGNLFSVRFCRCLRYESMQFTPNNRNGVAATLIRPQRPIGINKADKKEIENMGRYILKRLLWMIPVMLGIAILISRSCISARDPPHRFWEPAQPSEMKQNREEMAERALFVRL